MFSLPLPPSRVPEVGLSHVLALKLAVGGDGGKIFNIFPPAAPAGDLKQMNKLSDRLW